MLFCYLQEHHGVVSDCRGFRQGRDEVSDGGWGSFFAGGGAGRDKALGERELVQRVQPVAKLHRSDLQVSNI